MATTVEELKASIRVEGADTAAKKLREVATQSDKAAQSLGGAAKGSKPLKAGLFNLSKEAKNAGRNLGMNVNVLAEMAFTIGNVVPAFRNMAMTLVMAGGNAVVMGASFGTLGVAMAGAMALVPILIELFTDQASATDDAAKSIGDLGDSIDRHIQRLKKQAQQADRLNKVIAGEASLEETAGTVKGLQEQALVKRGRAQALARKFSKRFKNDDDARLFLESLPPGMDYTADNLAYRLGQRGLTRGGAVDTTGYTGRQGQSRGSRQSRQFRAGNITEEERADLAIIASALKDAAVLQRDASLAAEAEAKIRKEGTKEENEARTQANNERLKAERERQKEAERAARRGRAAASRHQREMERLERERMQGVRLDSGISDIMQTRASELIAYQRSASAQVLRGGATVAPTAGADLETTGAIEGYSAAADAYASSWEHGVKRVMEAYEELGIAAERLGGRIEPSIGMAALAVKGATSDIANSLEQTARGAIEGNLQAWVAGEQSIGDAVKGIAKTIIQGLVAQSVVNAIFQTAEGIAALASFNYPKAAGHFAAAGTFAAVGAVAAGVGFATGAIGGGGKSGAGNIGAAQPSDFNRSLAPSNRTLDQTIVINVGGMALATKSDIGKAARVALAAERRENAPRV